MSIYDWFLVGVNAMYMYCLFCNTSNRSHIAETIQQLMGIKVIAPKILRRKWIHGEIVDTIQDYLPGYCFLYADKPINEFAMLVQLKDVYRILGNRDDGYQLRGSDRAFAGMLWSCGGVIGVLKTYKVGDRIMLAENSFGENLGKIIKIDRRGRALICFGFDGVNIQSWVTIEQIESPENNIPSKT